jgi:beta-1,4-N-acetylglucosaminyltransferase
VSGFIIRSDIAFNMKPRDLTPAIQNSEQFRTKMTQFPPPTSGKHRETKSFAAIMDETMGFLD